MKDFDEDPVYLTLTEAKDEYPNASKNYNWTAKMFFYFFQAGLLRRRFNHKIKSYEYSKKSLLKILRMVNENLDELKINLRE